MHRCHLSACCRSLFCLAIAVDLMRVSGTSTVVLDERAWSRQLETSCISPHPRRLSALFIRNVVFTFQYERVGEMSTHRLPSFVPLVLSSSSMRSAGRASALLVDKLGCTGSRRCACSLRTFLSAFLSFLSSFRLDSPPYAFTPLASAHSFANDWPSQLVRTRAIVSARSALPVSGTRVSSNVRVCSCLRVPFVSPFTRDSWCRGR